MSNVHYPTLGRDEIVAAEPEVVADDPEVVAAVANIPGQDQAQIPGILS
jgi:hypothetical protein